MWLSFDKAGNPLFAVNTAQPSLTRLLWPSWCEHWLPARNAGVYYGSFVTETRARCVATSCCVESVEEQTEKQQWDENRTNWGLCVKYVYIVKNLRSITRITVAWSKRSESPIRWLDSMTSEVYRARASIWSRNFKESKPHVSGISKSHEDPMPDYISPELVTLIAQNAPSELEVFKSPIKQWSKGPSRGGSEDWQDRGEGGWIKRAIEFGIQELLHSGNGSNNNPRLTRRDARRSCPEATWSGYDTEDSRAPRAPRAPKVKNVKRKRPESLDVGKSESPRDETGDPVSRESASPIQPNPRTDQKDNHVGATADEVAPSSKSVGFTSSGVDQKREVRRPASAPAVSTSRYESDALNAKPWRHGMKKRTSTELKPTDTISCKRKAPVDPKKHFEVNPMAPTGMYAWVKLIHFDLVTSGLALPSMTTEHPSWVDDPHLTLSTLISRWRNTWRRSWRSRGTRGRSRRHERRLPSPPSRRSSGSWTWNAKPCSDRKFKFATKPRSKPN